MRRSPFDRPRAARRVSRTGQALPPFPAGRFAAASLRRLPPHVTGEVIEILEREGRRELTVLLPAGAVLTVVDDGWEGHLGDTFVFGGPVSIGTVQPFSDPAGTHPPGLGTKQRDRRRE